jgi:expansin (peptidoglycan-binding protein)
MAPRARKGCAATLAATAAALACGGTSGLPGSIAPLGEAQSGIATYYRATGDGACMFGPTGDLDVTAMNHVQYAGSAACGQCVEVEGPGGTVAVRVVDLCPECGVGHLDLSALAFARIADPADGRVDIRWTPVTCPVAGNVAYRFKEGSSRWWTAIQVRNHRLPIQALAYRTDGDWIDVPREDYNYFVVAGGVGTDGPFEVRITAVDGQELEDELPGVQAGQVFTGSGQFQ